MSDGATIAPARLARSNRGASRVLHGGTAVSPRVPIALRSAEDMAGLRAAGALVARALERVTDACVPGMTTGGLDALIRSTIEAGGGSPVFLGYRGSRSSNMGERPPYPASSCISVNDELVHGVPGGRVIRCGDVVSIDAGARLDGWCADSAVSVCVGEVSPAACALVDCAEDMLSHAIAAIRPGVRWSTIARELESIAASRGMAVAVDFVGHGIGRDLHEPPQVPCSVYASFLAGGDFTLRPGMVLAIEPMVVLEAPRRNDRGELVNPNVTLAGDGWTVMVDSRALSCHVEHTVAVTRDGSEVLTARRSVRTAAERSAVHPLHDPAPLARRVG
jgi:methionyl aminopeptidase